MIIDSNGLQVEIGDKVMGEGVLLCNDGFKIDLTSIVRVTERNGTVFFGGLSKSSFKKFWKITSDYKPKLSF